MTAIAAEVIDKMPFFKRSKVEVVGQKIKVYKIKFISSISFLQKYANKRTIIDEISTLPYLGCYNDKMKSDRPDLIYGFEIYLFPKMRSWKFKLKKFTTFEPLT